MSRQSTVPVVRPEQLAVHPTIKGKQRAAKWCTENILPVTVNAIERASVSGELASFMIGGARWFAERDLLTWIMSKRESASGAGHSGGAA